MKAIRYWEFTQVAAATMWEIDNVPEGAISPSILEVHAEGGAIIQPDSQQLAPYGIQLVFGVTPVEGVAIGKYFVEVPDDPQVVQDGYGNNVTITVTQNGGGVPSGNTF